jgi:hypothetical protein
MITPGSRYEDADHVFTQAHVYNEFGYPYLQDDATNLKVIIVNRETTYRVTTLNTDPVQQQEYYVKEGETFQFLAFKFFSDPKRWHEIADANPSLWYPLDAGMGDYIQVPPEAA